MFIIPLMFVMQSYVGLNVCGLCNSAKLTLAINNKQVYTTPFSTKTENFLSVLDVNYKIMAFGRPENANF